MFSTLSAITPGVLRLRVPPHSMTSFVHKRPLARLRVPHVAPSVTFSLAFRVFLGRSVRSTTHWLRSIEWSDQASQGSFSWDSAVLGMSGLLSISACELQVWIYLCSR